MILSKNIYKPSSNIKFNYKLKAISFPLYMFEIMTQIYIFGFGKLWQFTWHRIKHLRYYLHPYCWSRTCLTLDFMDNRRIESIIVPFRSWKLLTRIVLNSDMSNYPNNDRYRKKTLHDWSNKRRSQQANLFDCAIQYHYSMMVFV